MGDPVTTLTLAEVLGGLSLEALRPMLSRAARVARKRTGKLRPDFYAAYAAQLKKQSARPSLLALYESLPDNLTLNTLSKVLSSSSALGFIRQLAALNIIGNEGGSVASINMREENRRRLYAGFSSFLAESLNVTHILPSAATKGQHLYIARDNYTTFVNSVIDVLDKYSKLAAEQLINSAREHDYAISWAQAILAQATLESIERYAALSAGASRPDLMQENSWLEDYQRAFIACHQGIELPDQDERRSVLYTKLYVKPSLRSEDGNSASLESLLSDLDRIVILGDPGAGKSTISHVIGLSLIEERRFIPFHLVMRDIDDPSTGFSIVNEIEKCLEQSYQLKPLKNLVEKLLVDGSATLIFDGLDELLEPSNRKRAAQIIEMAARRFPLVPIVVTCRHVGYSQAQLDTDIFATFSIEPFDEPRVREYVTNWFEQQPNKPNKVSGQPDAIEVKVDDFMRSSASIDDMRANALLLSFICVLYRGIGYIPQNRPQLFGKCVDLLLRAWDSAHGVTVSVADDTYELALAEVAEYVMSNNTAQRGMPESVLKSLFASHLMTGATYTRPQANAVATIMVEHCRGRAWIFREVGLAVDGERLYAFTHSSFLEYFYAWSRTRRAVDLNDLATELYGLLQAGRSQVAVQVAIHLYEHRTSNGGSLCVAELLRRLMSSNANSVQASSILDVILDGVDAVNLQSDALSLLCQAMMWQVIGPVRRHARDLTLLWAENFRHVHGIPTVLPGVFQSLIGHGGDEVQLRLCWLLVHAAGYLPTGEDWDDTVAAIYELDLNPSNFDEVILRCRRERDELAWHLGLRRGLGFGQVADPVKAFVRLFEPCSDVVAELGDRFNAIWILKVLAYPERNERWIPHAMSILRGMSHWFDPDRLAEFDLPDPWIEELRGAVRSVLKGGIMGRALRQFVQADEEPSKGMFYLAISCIDVCGELVPSNRRVKRIETYEDGFHQVYRMLMIGCQKLPSEFCQYLSRWSPGHIWVPEWSQATDVS